MLQGIFGTAVQLELKDVNDIFCLHHGIGTTTRTAHFRLYELTQQSEDDIKDGLVVAFGIVAQFVGNACKEYFQTFHESIHITGTEFTHKLGYVETGFIIGHFRIIRYQKIQETIAYLIIGKTQSVQ